MKKLAFIVIAALAMVFTACDNQSSTQKDYEDLERKHEALVKAWGQVERVYLRRADLVPNLFTYVKDCMENEQETLNAVREARIKVSMTEVNIENFDKYEFAKFESVQQELSKALNRLFAVAENYPDLKASDTYLNLQAQIEGCENQILTERECFNKAAEDYNKIARKLNSKECPCFVKE